MQRPWGGDMSSMDMSSMLVLEEWLRASGWNIIGRVGDRR